MFGFNFGRSAPIKTLTPQDAHRLAKDGSVLLVDVREAHEWAQGHVPGAHHAPLSNLHNTATALPKDKQVVFYCMVGGRSSKAVEICQKMGLPHDSHMGGGIGAWRMHGLPIVM
jgi:rhodanese-related sulfurtransferase